jgi:O-antigen/teichoic acid export membrane protein
VVTTVLDVGGSAADRITFIGVAALYTLGHAGTELGMYHHQAHLAFKKAGLLGVLRSGATCLAALAAAGGLISSGPMIALCISLGVVAVGGTVCTPLMLATWGSRHALEGRLGFGYEANWLSVFSMASAGFSYSTMFLVAGLLDETAVASYGAAMRYSSIVFGPVPALRAVLRVRTSQRDVVDSLSTQIDMLLRWMKRTTLPILAVMGAMAALAPLAIPLADGGRYPQSVTVFQLLMIAAVVDYVTMPAAQMLQSQRRYRLLALVFAGAVAVMTAGSVIAGSLFGLVGIAIVAVTCDMGARATLAAIVLWTRPGSARTGERAVGEPAKVPG